MDKPISSQTVRATKSNSEKSVCLIHCCREYAKKVQAGEADVLGFSNSDATQDLIEDLLSGLLCLDSTQDDAHYKTFVIKGSRRIGKTTILKKVLKKYKEKEFFNKPIIKEFMSVEETFVSLLRICVGSKQENVKAFFIKRIV